MKNLIFKEVHFILLLCFICNYIDSRWSIVGVTEQYILGKTDRLHYLKEVELIGGHIGRICETTVNYNSMDSMLQSFSKPSNATNLRIESAKEYK